MYSKIGICGHGTIARPGRAREGALDLDCRAPPKFAWSNGNLVFL